MNSISKIHCQTLAIRSKNTNGLYDNIKILEDKYIKAYWFKCVQGNISNFFKQNNSFSLLSKQPLSHQLAVNHNLKVS